MDCCFWHAPLESLQSDLVLAKGTHMLMQNREAELRILLRKISTSMNQSIHELGERQQSELDALLARNYEIDLSMSRGLLAQKLRRMADMGREETYVKRRKILEETNFTKAQLTAMLKDSS